MVRRTPAQIKSMAASKLEIPYAHPKSRRHVRTESLGGGTACRSKWVEKTRCKSECDIGERSSVTLRPVRRLLACSSGRLCSCQTTCTPGYCSTPPGRRKNALTAGKRFKAQRGQETTCASVHGSVRLDAAKDATPASLVPVEERGGVGSASAMRAANIGMARPRGPRVRYYR